LQELAFGAIELPQLVQCRPPATGAASGVAPQVAQTRAFGVSEEPQLAHGRA
jgi:hypothetical protein